MGAIEPDRIPQADPGRWVRRSRAVTAVHGWRLWAVTEPLDQFVEDFGLVPLARPSVTITPGGHDFPAGDLTHLAAHDSETPFLSGRMVPQTISSPPSATFFLSQFAGQNFLLFFWTRLPAFAKFLASDSFKLVWRKSA